MLGVVIQIDGFDPVAGAAVALRAGSHDDAAVCHLDGQTWWPALTKLPTLRYDLFDGAFGGQITAPSSTLRLSVEPWPDFGRYALADARLRLWTGDLGTPWSSWTLRFDGRVSEQPETEDGQADVSFAVDDRWLDAALLATYAGTGGAEGSAELKGQPKPLALGAPRYAAGVLVDPINNVFQVSAYGAIESIEAALERLARFGTPVADYPSHAALVGAAIPPGRWATCLAEGKARLGAPPTGQISLLVRGDKAGPNGWARKPGQLIRRLALLSGGAGRIHDASLNALDVARPYNVSLYLDQQTTARQMIQQLAASVNAVAAMSWTGQLFVVPVAIGAPALTLAADGSALPPVGKVRQVSIASPFKKLAIGAERAWTVHALGDIAFTATLVDMGAYAAGTTYREGNIVQSGGSTWLYINPAATAGNAPPALPIEENAFWRVLARAGADGRDGTDGTDGINGADGTDGADGATPYFHFAWANSLDGTVNFTTGAQGGRTYQGVYIDHDPGSDSNSPAAYTWSRYTGQDGQDGADGIDGADGTKIHKAYANSPDGTVDFSVTNPAGRAYLGLRVDYQVPDSTNPGDYAWSLIKGANGTDGTNGASAFTLINLANMAVTQDSATKVAGGAAWNGKARTLQGYVGAAVSGRLLSQGTLIGLTTDPDAGNYETIDYAAHVSEDGNFYLFRNGTIFWGPSGGGYGSTFTIVSDTKTVKYTINGNLLVEHPVNSPDEVLYAAAVAYREGQTIDQIAFAPNGRAGANGQNGTPATVVTASTQSLVFLATAGGVIKSGNDQQSVSMTMMRGSDDVTAQATWAVVGSSNAGCQFGLSGRPANVATIYDVSGAGYMDLQGTFGGVSQVVRVSFIVVRDNPPPASQTSGGGSISYGLSSTSFEPVGQSVSLRATSGGTLTVSLSAEYYVDQGGTGNRLFTASATMAFRTAGGGWNYPAEVQGSQSRAIGSNDVEPGSVNYAATLSGLTPDGFYEVVPVMRKAFGSTNASALVSGQYAVSQ